ncbi:MAG: hypothetical protein ACTSRP_09170 [Candidatus Helarchaeota archaeon]
MKMIEIEGKKFVNLTPHSVNLIMDNKEIEIKPSGIILRLGEIDKKIEELIIERKYELSENITRREDTYYIVSSIVQFVANRDDFVSPDTGSTAVRDENGRIKAVKRFVKIRW